MNKYLVMESSTGVIFLTHAFNESAALRYVSKHRTGHSHNTDLFEASRLIDMPEGTVARVKLFDHIEPPTEDA